MEGESPKACAGEILETVPLVMQFIRVEMRRSRGPGISVPQFRVLTFLSRTDGASLSAVADRVGLSLPAMSRLIDGLVSRELVQREESSEDRRRVTLRPTTLGGELVRTARAGAKTRLAEALTELAPAERATLAEAMELLHRVFLPKPRSPTPTEG